MSEQVIADAKEKKDAEDDGHLAPWVSASWAEHSKVASGLGLFQFISSSKTVPPFQAKKMLMYRMDGQNNRARPLGRAQILFSTFPSRIPSFH